jgi:hypothetical protein
MKVEEIFTLDSTDGTAVAPSGNAHITGFTDSTDFFISTWALQTTFGGVSHAFVSKLALATALRLSNSTAKLQLAISTGSSDLNSAFTVGAAGTSINPLRQNVTLQIGSYSVTIPSGSLIQKSKEALRISGNHKRRCASGQDQFYRK